MNKVIEEEEEECRKYVYVGDAVDSNADLEARKLHFQSKIISFPEGGTASSLPVPPPRKGRISPAPPSPENESTNQPAPSVPQVTFNVDDTPTEVDGNSFYFIHTLFFLSRR